VTRLDFLDLDSNQAGQPALAELPEDVEIDGHYLPA
jgi:hypothetical protein